MAKLKSGTRGTLLLRLSGTLNILMGIFCLVLIFIMMERMPVAVTNLTEETLANLNLSNFGLENYGIRNILIIAGTILGVIGLISFFYGLYTLNNAKHNNKRASFIVNSIIFLAIFVALLIFSRSLIFIAPIVIWALMFLGGLLSASAVKPEEAEAAIEAERKAEAHFQHYRSQNYQSSTPNYGARHDAPTYRHESLQGQGSNQFGSYNQPNPYAHRYGESQPQSGFDPRNPQGQQGWRFYDQNQQQQSYQHLGNMNQQGQNPHGQQGFNPQQNRYGQQGSQNPYQNQYGQANRNPYQSQFGQDARNPQQNQYGQDTRNPQQNQYGQGSQNQFKQGPRNPYQNNYGQAGTQQNPYGQQNQNQFQNSYGQRANNPFENRNPHAGQGSQNQFGQNSYQNQQGRNTFTSTQMPDSVTNVSTPFAGNTARTNNWTSLNTQNAHTDLEQDSEKNVIQEVANELEKNAEPNLDSNNVDAKPTIDKQDELMTEQVDNAFVNTFDNSNLNDNYVEREEESIAEESNVEDVEQVDIDEDEKSES